MAGIFNSLIFNIDIFNTGEEVLEEEVEQPARPVDFVYADGWHQRGVRRRAVLAERKAATNDDLDDLREMAAIYARWRQAA